MILAQLSDTHVRVGDERVAGRLRAVSAYLDALDGIDAVLVTGDVTSDGLPEELDLFLALAPQRHPLVLLPGNHDRRGPVGDDDRLRPRVLDLGDAVLRTLDTTIPGFDDGYLGPDVLAALDEALTTDPRPTLVGLHHPPARLLMAADRWPLHDMGALASVVARHPHVLALLAGHAHHAATATCGGRPLLVCPSVKNAALLPGEGEGLRRGDDPVVLLHEARDGALVSHVRAVHERG